MKIGQSFAGSSSHFFDVAPSTFGIDEGPFLFTPTGGWKQKTRMGGFRSGKHVLDHNKFKLVQHAIKLALLDPRMRRVCADQPKATNGARLYLAHDPVIRPGILPENLGQFEFRPLFKDELRFLVSPFHAWARTGRADRSEIPYERFILYAKCSYTSEMIEMFFRREGVVLPTSIELGNIEAIKELVKLGLGVSILAPWVARRELAEGALTALPLGPRKLQRSWGILLRKGQRLSLAQETFIGLCSAVSDNLRF